MAKKSVVVRLEGLEVFKRLAEEHRQLTSEMDKLTVFTLTEFPQDVHPTGKLESPVDVAIRLLSERK